MANTLINDVIIPEIYADYLAVDGPEKTAFFAAGVAARNPLLDTMASGGGRILTVPFWKDLDASDEPNYSTDATTDVAAPAKVVAGEQIARLAFLNQGYSSADIAAELAGSDPMQRVRNRFGTYWMRQWQRRVIASLEGLLADNVANDSSDMVNDVSGATNADVTASTVFSRAAFTGAAFTSGDHFDDYQAVAVHSVVYKRMVDNDDVEFVPDSQGQLTIPTFMGRRIIVDDGLPFTPAAGALAGDAAAKYTSILFASAAIGYGEGTPRTPVEIEREAAQGNGGGIETLWERKQWLIHPFGFQFTSNTVTGQSPTWANLRLAVNWNRVVERKNVPIAFLTTNG
jgi:hypothetical protein